MCAAYYYSGGGSDGANSNVILNNNTTLVVDIGSYSSKVGWAGDDYPRGYFRSNVAVRRTPYPNHPTDDEFDYNNDNAMDIDENEDPSKQQQQRSNNYPKGRIVGGNDNIKYDYYTRSIVKNNATTHEYDDGPYEPCNPIDMSTGLFYESIRRHTNHTTEPAASNTGGNHNSLNSNNDGIKDDATTDPYVPDWYDMMQQFIQHTYDSALRGSDPLDHPVLLSERSYNSPAIRQKMMECLFEECHVPAAFLAKDAVLQCYGVGKTSAISVDIGYSGVTVTPVYDGSVEPKGIQRSPIGIKSMDELLLYQLDRIYAKSATRTNQKDYVMPLYQVRREKDHYSTRKPSIHQLCRLCIAQECRELDAGAAINTTQIATTGAASSMAAPIATFHAPNQSFELPDGTMLDIPSADRFRSADYLFGNNGTTMIPNVAGSTMTTTLQERREQEYHQTKRNLLSYCSSISNAVSFITKRGPPSSANANNNDENQKIYQQAALAVGIVSRKEKEELRLSKMNAGIKTTTTNTAITDVNWHRACLNDLQTLANDQLTSSPIATMICDSAYKCDRDQQAILLGNVVVGGGGAASIGPTEQAVPDLIRDNVEALIHAHTPGWRVKVYTPNSYTERSVLAWLGGSILGSINTFHNMYITRAEYDEWGSAIVNRKCP